MSFQCVVALFSPNEYSPCGKNLPAVEISALIRIQNDTTVPYHKHTYTTWMKQWRRGGTAFLWGLRSGRKMKWRMRIDLARSSGVVWLRRRIAFFWDLRRGKKIKGRKRKLTFFRPTHVTFSEGKKVSTKGLMENSLHENEKRPFLSENGILCMLDTCLTAQEWVELVFLT